MASGKKKSSRPAKGISSRELLVYALLSSGSVVMLFLALPGFERWYLSFAGLAPLLIILQRAPLRRAVLMLWLAGFLFAFLSVYWLNVLSPIGWVMLGFYLSLYFLAFALIARAISSGRPHIPFVVSAPVTWVGLDMLRAVLLGGFPWHYLGHNLYRQTQFIQIADFAGVYGVTFVVVTVNAWLARVIYLAATGEFRERRQPLYVLLGMAWTLLLVTGTLYYGSMRSGEYEPVEGPRISVVQGNIPQRLKEYQNDTPEEAQRKIIETLRTYRDLTIPLRPEAGQSPVDDMVVWPETIIPAMEGNIRKSPETGELVDISKDYMDWAKSIRAGLGRPFLVGSLRYENRNENWRYYNAVFYFPKDDGPAEGYLKLHLVPFGEYIPIREIPWINRLLEKFLPEGYESVLSAGDEAVLFSVKGVRFATPICYEDTMPYLIRRFVKKGARFIVNVTNDGWFGDTAELDQHLANSVFRAVENRIGMARAANTGISAFIDPLGRVTARIEDAQGKHREVAGTLTGTILLDDRKTFYTQHGDIFGWLMAGWIPLFMLLRGARHWVERDRLK